MIGQTLSHYRITAALGAGGMGEVYRATDSHLEREVAIKVLPQEVAESPERMSRFKREARLLAALNHPNIAAIYGLEEADGKPFLALELVDGEDLKDRLEKGPIPVQEALEIAVQIAEALEEAHGKNIVHRDLKPANVKITADGKVKVLDFGLAKAWGGDPSEGGFGASALSLSPTIAHTETAVGVILGTAAYMSPEQARGKPVDKRADVWAFGVVMWEMLTNQTLFGGETVTDVLAAVVRKQPDLEALPDSTPPAVRLLIERCLRKDPRTRLPDIGAARLELQDAIAGVSESFHNQQGLTEARAKSGKLKNLLRQPVWALTALLAAAIAGALGYLHLTEAAPAKPVVRFSVDAPEGWSLGGFQFPSPSPDGRHVVFSATSEDDGQRMLWIRSLDSVTLRPLAGTEGEETGQAIWSLDSRFIAFVTNKEIRKINFADGSIQVVCKLPYSGFGGGTWTDDDRIVFASGEGGPGPLYSVSARGGEPQEIISPDQPRGERGFALPAFIKTSRQILLVVLGTGENIPGVYTFSLENPEPRKLLTPGLRRVRIVGESLLFSAGNSLLGQKLPPTLDQLLREGTTVSSSLGFWEQNPGMGFFGTSESGVLAFIAGDTVSGEVQLVWFDRNGRQVGQASEPGDYGQIALSPDERNIAFEVSDASGQFDLWVMDVTRGVPSRVTATPGDERDPVWSPDSLSLAFIARRDETADLRTKGLRAGDPETVLADSPEEDIPEYWTRDRQTILTVRRTSEDQQSVWAISVTGGEAEPILVGDFRIDEPQLSPDGRWLAYVSDESGQDDVYLEPFNREGQRLRVSVEGGGQPKWRGDGRELFFVSPSSRLMSVDVKVTDRLEVSLPVELFELPGIQGMGYDDYAPSSDGQRFLVKRPIEKGQASKLQIVTNWASLLD